MAEQLAAWPFLHALDERGGDTGWVLLNGPIVAFLTLAGNLIADVLYAVADPRIRYQ